MTDIYTNPQTYGTSCIPMMKYSTISIKDIVIDREPPSHNAPGRIINMEIDGVDRPVNCSNRFINSFLGLFGLSKSVFNLFSHEEVVERLLIKGKGDKVRIALQPNINDTYTALAVMKPTKPYIESFDLYEMLSNMGIPESDIKYTLGVVRSTHKPSVLGDSEVDINGDNVVRRFVMDVPIDGYGAPSSYLSLIRLVCSNGMISEAPAFRSQLNIGDSTYTKNGGLVFDAMPTVRKYIESHNNEEGFHVLTERMRIASQTPASLDEFNKLYKLMGNLPNLHRKSGDNSDINYVLQNLAGEDLMEKYGLVSLDQISAKKRKLVPVECTVMNLINVASELSTHRANPYESKKLSAFIGQSLSEEFDLEGADTIADKSTDLYMVNYKDAHGFDDVREIN